LEKYFFARWKTAVCKWLFWPGLIIVVAGQALGMMAILQGKRSFTREIQVEKG
jgi:hypothetical protein